MFHPLRPLAKNVLETIVSVYIHMRNRLCLRGRGDQNCAVHAGSSFGRAEKSRAPAPLKIIWRQKPPERKSKVKLDRLHWVIGHYGLKLTPEEMHRARRTIKGYELEAIRLTETTFLKATQRKSDRLNLPYFFWHIKKHPAAAR